MKHAEIESTAKFLIDVGEYLRIAEDELIEVDTREWAWFPQLSRTPDGLSFTIEIFRRGWNATVIFSHRLLQVRVESDEMDEQFTGGLGSYNVEHVFRKMIVPSLRASVEVMP